VIGGPVGAIGEAVAGLINLTDGNWDAVRTLMTRDKAKAEEALVARYGRKNVRKVEGYGGLPSVRMASPTGVP